MSENKPNVELAWILLRYAYSTSRSHFDYDEFMSLCRHVFPTTAAESASPDEAAFLLKLAAELAGNPRGY